MTTDAERFNGAIGMVEGKRLPHRTLIDWEPKNDGDTAQGV